MWAIENTTAFAVERAWVRDLQGAEVWLVAVKGLFEIYDNDHLELTAEQESVNLAPRFRDPNKPSSLLADTDLPHQKIATDILIEGQAYAPAGQAVSYVDVRLDVEHHFSKTLRVFGNRQWYRTFMAFAISAAEPFVQMPLIWEKAFGGSAGNSGATDYAWEARNPVGCGFATRAEQVENMPLPNIELPQQLIEDWRQRPTPAGFAPIAGHWATRLQHAGTYDAHWERERHPLLPLDFNPRFYQAAPADQQTTGFLNGGERIQCCNMSPQGPLSFRVPRIALLVDTFFASGKKITQRPVMHSLTIKPDKSQVAIVWHTYLQCHADAFMLTKSVVRYKQRVEITNRGVSARDDY